MTSNISFEEGTTIKGYLFKQSISRGPYSTIFKGINKQTLQSVILKVVPFDKIKAIVKFGQFFNYEKDILLKCKNQNIVKLLEIVSQQSAEILVLQYCNGPTLEDIIQEKQKLTEKYASYILKQILNAFIALKSINAMHRDFKTQHVYFHNDIVKIGGFSFSKVLKSYNGTTDTSLGTAYTMAPQVLRGEDYGANADIWSIGAVFYKMLFGKYPYRGQDDQQILKSIQTQKIEFEGAMISQNCKDFIEQCLRNNPKKRLDWQTIQDHPFIKSLNSCDFREFRTQNTMELYQNLKKSIQIQRQQKKKKIIDLEKKIRQLMQELAKQRNEVKSLKFLKQQNQKLIKKLKKQVDNKNANIDHYQKLLSDKKQQAQQKGKLSERLNLEIRKFNDKILDSYINENPIYFENLKSKSPKKNSKINLKTNKLYVIDEQKFNMLIKMNQQMARRQKQGLSKSNLTNTNSTQVSESRDNFDEEFQDQPQIRQKKQTEKVQNYQFYKPTQKQRQKFKQTKSQTIEIPIQQNIRLSFKKKQPQYRIQPIIIKADDLYFEKDILKNQVQALINIKQTIQAQSLQKIQSSALVYKKTSGTKDLVHKIRQIFNTNNHKRGFLALFQTNSKNKFSIFCYKNGDNFKTILINIDNNKVFRPKKQNKIDSYLYRSSSQKIFLGAGQIIIKNHPPQLQVDLHIIGDKYFNIEKIEQLTGSNESQVSLSEIQIFDIKFKK